jgi:Amt family ammonium transporter
LKKVNPSNISDVFLGTCLIWFGFFGFAGGSEFAINARAVMAVINCNLAAGVGGLTWMFAEMIKHRKKKMSLNGFCSGAISGLCVITPSAGYIRPHFAVVCGVIGTHQMICL